MKISRCIFRILWILPLIAVLIALPLLPEQIPAHYGIDGQVDRFGSKYETLIFPAITITFGLLMQGIAIIVAKQEKQGMNNEKIVRIAGIFALLVFNVMTGYFLYIAFAQVHHLTSVSLDMANILFLVLGIFMIVIGNFMPKLRLNPIVGLRTPWSMKNETTWKKSQRFGGISSMVTGVLISLTACFTKGLICVLCSTGLLLLSVIADVIYTYVVAKRYSDTSKDPHS